MDDAVVDPALPHLIDRRHALRGLGAIGVGALVAGCSSDAGPAAAPTPEPSVSPTTSPGAAPVPPPSAGASTSVVPSDWAVGGTQLITAAYPGDDIFDEGGICALALSTALAEGPCYYSEDTGEDISSGLTGLPMQLCLRVVDAGCRPLADHVVEVWHCDTLGRYSGDSSGSADAAGFRADFCTGGDAEAASTTFFRGRLTSDAAGRVNFSTCFPGWYPGRTVHIHVAVSDQTGDRRIVSQVCFTDELVTEITSVHEVYADRGDQDTPLASGNDLFNRAPDFEDFVMATRRNADGTLLAYHTIQVL